MKKLRFSIILIFNCCLISLFTNQAALCFTIYAGPTVSIVADKTVICTGSSITFTATTTGAGNATVFQWYINGRPVSSNTKVFNQSGLNDQDKITCGITNTGDPSVTGEIVSNTIVVSTGSILTPILTLEQTITSPCSLTFTAKPTNPGTLPIYQWTRNGIPVGSNSAIYVDNNPVTGAVITCKLTNTTTCSVAATATKSITAMAGAGTLIVSLETQSSRTVCTGTPISFKAVTNFDDAGMTYDWKVNGASIGVTTQTYESSILKDKDQVSCTVTAPGNCLANPSVTSNPSIVNIVQETIPVVTITADTYATCAGTPVHFTVHAAPLINPTYRWLVNGSGVGTNDPEVTISTLKNGDKVTCTVNNQSGCSTQITGPPVSVVIYDAPIISFDNNPTINIGGQVALNPVITGNAVNYSWTPATGLSSTTTANIVASPPFTTTYQLLATNDKGCTSTASVTVTVISNVNPINVFTPNGDGVNDTWKMPELLAYPNCVVDVFNRYGQAVFHSIGYGKPWDGTNNGTKLPAGTYFYMIDTKDGSAKISGSITIVR